MTARINISVPQEIHRSARVYAVQNGMTLAQVVVEALRRMLDPERGMPAPRSCEPNVSKKAAANSINERID